MSKFTGNHNKKFTGFYLLLLGVFCLCNFFSMTVRAVESSQSPAEHQSSIGSELSAATQSLVSNSVAASPVAGTAPKMTLPAKPSTSSQLANLVGGLGLILLLIYGLSWFVKRFTQGGFMQNSAIKMLSSMPLGTRERLLLVDVAGKQMLLGVTGSQINMLHLFEEPVIAADRNSQPSQVAASSDFSQKLMAILQQKTSGKSQPPEHKNRNE